MHPRRLQANAKPLVATPIVRSHLHALGPLFRDGIAHNWCRENPVTAANLKSHGAKTPSDADAVRMHVLTPSEEMAYFKACLQPPKEISKSKSADTDPEREACTNLRLRVLETGRAGLSQSAQYRETD